MEIGPLVLWIEQHVPSLSARESLAFQNHLYGCFIVMEDIAQGILSYAEGTLTRTDGSFRLVARETFGEWGIRYYGFLVDGRAVWTTCTPAYQEMWMGLFQGLSMMRKVEAGKAVDAMEDTLISLLQRHLPADAFFFVALENEGSLTHGTVERVLNLLAGSPASPAPVSFHVPDVPAPVLDAPPASDALEEESSSVLSHALSDPPRIKRRLAVTRRRSVKEPSRRSVRETIKHSLATTRRRK